MKSVKHFEESIQSHFVVRARCMAIPRIHACKGYTEWVLETPIQSDYGSFRSQPSPHCMSITRLKAKVLTRGVDGSSLSE